jgi:FkbM family methyltransferase
MTVTGSFLQRLYYAYFLGPDHPTKLRICGYLRKMIRDGRVVIPYNGTGRIGVDEADHIQRYILQHGCYEQEVFDALMRCADRQEVVWDVGANIGSFSILAMMDPRVAVAYAFEPLPNTFRLLAENIAMNRGSCVLLNSGLSDKPEVLSLSSGVEGNSGMASIGPPSGAKCWPIECSSVDFLVSNGYLRRPTLMKIDVEGWEFRVLAGAQETFAQQGPKAIVFEAECDSYRRILDPGLAAFFEPRGYEISWIPRPDGAVQQRENYLAVRNS